MHEHGAYRPKRPDDHSCAITYTGRRSHPANHDPTSVKTRRERGNTDQDRARTVERDIIPRGTIRRDDRKTGQERMQSDVGTRPIRSMFHGLPTRRRGHDISTPRHAMRKRPLSMPKHGARPRQPWLGRQRACLSHRCLTPCIGAPQIAHALAQARHRGATPTPAQANPRHNRARGSASIASSLATSVLTSTIETLHHASTCHEPPLHRHMHSTSMPCPRLAKADPRHTQAWGSSPTFFCFVSHHPCLDRRGLTPYADVPRAARALEEAQQLNATPTPCTSNAEARPRMGLGPVVLGYTARIANKSVGASHRESGVAKAALGLALACHLDATLMPCKRSSSARRITGLGPHPLPTACTTAPRPWFGGGAHHGRALPPPTGKFVCHILSMPTYGQGMLRVPWPGRP
jgi:hypothetical protein